MKKHFKKLLITLVAAVGTLCLALGFSACKDEDDDVTEPTALAAPVLTISGNVISWGAVENADGYEVYENYKWKVDTTETSYTIDQTTPGTYVYEVKAVSEDPNFTASEKSNKQTYIISEKTEPLAAPQITIDEETGVISWDRVEHADGYHLFENDGKAINLTTTTYTITQKKDAGEYSYKVKAVSANKKYTESEMSNTAVFTVKQLAAPQNVAVDQTNAVLSWDAVDGAEAYAIYVDGSYYSYVEGTSYDITQSPGETRYEIAATTQVVKYAEEGAKSQAVKFNVPLVAIVMFQVPEGFTAENVEVGLYTNGDTLVKKVNVTDFAQSVRLVAPVAEYTVKLTGLPTGYVSSWATINADTQMFGAKVTVLEMNEETKMEVGSHTINVDFDEHNDGYVYTAEKEYIFIAEQTADGYYTLTTDDLSETTKTFRIFANGTKIIDTSTVPAFLVNSFRAKAGEPIVLKLEFEIYVEGASEDSVIKDTFHFELKAEETKQYLEVLPRPYDIDAEIDGPVYNEQKEKANYITGSCTRYIKVDATKKLTIMFWVATVGDRTINVKIKDREFTLVSGGILTEQYVDSDGLTKNRTAYVEFAAGEEVAIEINVTGSGYGGQDVISFHVYPEA